MKHNLWDRMMYRLLQEKKEKEVKASKSKGAKPDFLDLDKDGDKTEPMSKASKEAGGKKDAPKAKKGKGKIPPQLKMHIQKKKKSKLDEEIERLEKILFEELTDVPLEEYNEDRYPPMEEEDDDFDADELPEYSEEDFGDYGEESMKKFAQKSKAFADKYTEEDEYEETEETCPECGSDEFDGEHCDECGHEQSDEDNMDDDLEDDDLEDDDLEDDDLDDEDDDELYEAEEQYLSEAQVKKKKPRLGKVTRNPSGSKKKFHVYVKCGGRVKKISFGDPGLSIKRDSAARRKNFRARHKCDKPAGKDRCTARYWSCYQWRAGKKVEGE